VRSQALLREEGLAPGIGAGVEADAEVWRIGDEVSQSVPCALHSLDDIEPVPIKPMPIFHLPAAPLARQLCRLRTGQSCCSTA
jgi:hypothetical protein